MQSQTLRSHDQLEVGRGEDLPHANSEDVLASVVPSYCAGRRKAVRSRLCKERHLGVSRVQSSHRGGRYRDATNVPWSWATSKRKGKTFQRLLPKSTGLAICRRKRRLEVCWDFGHRCRLHDNGYTWIDLHKRYKTQGDWFRCKSKEPFCIWGGVRRDNLGSKETFSVWLYVHVACCCAHQASVCPQKAHGEATQRFFCPCLHKVVVTEKIYLSVHNSVQLLVAVPSWWLWLPLSKSKDVASGLGEQYYSGRNHRLLLSQRRKQDSHRPHQHSRRSRWFFQALQPLSTPRLSLGHLGYYEPFLVTPVMIRGFCFAAMAPCLDRKKMPRPRGCLREVRIQTWAKSTTVRFWDWYSIF